MKKDKGNRSFIGRLVVFVLSLLAMLGVVCMAMSVLSSHVDPKRFVWLAYFGLAFWAILLYNLVIFVLLLLLWSRRIKIAILALIIAIPGIINSFSMGKTQEGSDFRLMTYNLHNFSYLNPEKTLLETAEIIAAMVNEHHPDVLCIQEYSNFNTKISRKDCVAQLGEMMGLPYAHYNAKSSFGGNVILSRYPLSAVEDEGDFGKENQYGTIAVVDAGEKGTFTVVCCHLTSYQITDKEIGALSDKDNSKEEMKTYGKSIIAKLKAAFERRSDEVAKMLGDIPHDGTAIILCGDMNDTPLSYTYHQIKKAGFTDGFVKSGRGIGHTYAGKLPLLRIDYVWGNEQIQPMAFRRLKVKGSDHYPVMMDFNLSHGF